jgi:hypothetical protein
MEIDRINSGHAIIALSAIYFVLASYAILFSAFLPPTAIFVGFFFHGAKVPLNIRLFQVLDLLAQDTHYKYFIMLVIPMSIYFVIANWVGWQYYRNS